MSNFLSRAGLGIFTLGLFCLYPAKSFSQVIVNEICWMGTANSANNEWIELYNNTEDPAEDPISLDNWKLIGEDDSPKIVLKGTIPPRGFFLLERTDDQTLPQIPADQIYTGALENSGEHLKLFDNQNNLINEVNASLKWFAGENSTKKTMERKDPGSSGSDPNNWASSQNPGGTPKEKNAPKQSPLPSSSVETLPAAVDPGSQNDIVSKMLNISGDVPPVITASNIFGPAIIISLLSSLVVVFLLRKKSVF